MLQCQQCHDRLLDFVYGLLEDSEVAQVRAHVTSCSACQAALVQVQTEQKLLARAARAISVVPEFALPSETTAAPDPTPTLPLESERGVKRPIWKHPLVGWAIAASILIAVGTPIGWYEYQYHGYRTNLAEVRAEQKRVDDLLAVLPAAQASRHQKAIDKLHAEAVPHLHVVGPTTLQPGAKGHLHITTRHPEGNLAPANVSIKLADAKTGAVVKTVRLQTDGNGHARVELDAAGAAPHSKLNLLVDAAGANVQEALEVQGPSYVTRLDSNKNIYQVKDVLFFRVLVLDRYTMQPPTQPIPMHVELVHAKKVIRSLDRETGDGGILAAEFAIEEKFAPGEYTLNVRPANAAKTDVQTVASRIEIVRDLPGIRLDPNNYFAGGTVTGELVLRGGAPMPAQVPGTIGGQPVPITLKPQPTMQGGFGGGPGVGGGAKAKGGAKKDPSKDAKADDKAEHIYRFSAPLPKDLPKGVNSLPFAVQLPGEDKLKAIVPLTPTEFAVDFFPEGGDLIAGVKNRVYFRVRAKTGESVTSDGRLILWMKAKDDSLQILVDEAYQLGMGQFEFEPDAKQAYTVRVTTPTSTAEIADPFARLGIHTEGVVLHVAKAVGKQNEPIRLTLRQQGPTRKLLLVAQCRGQIVDERWVEVKRGEVHLTLEPTADARGLIRVTAYEIAGADVIPVAERLVYRASAQRLDLAFTPNMREFDAGSKTSAKVSARDENGQLTGAWILASVVDERFQARPRSLSAHFLLMNEIRGGADLDQAQIVLHDAPESAEVLERFLGTHGWRRYVEKKPAAIVPAANVLRNVRPEPALIFSRESQPIATVQKQYEDRLAAVLTPIRKEAIGEEIRLNNERERLALAVRLASANLADFENNVQIGIRLALGAFVGLLLAVSVFLMGLGTYRILRTRSSATPSFGGAFACLVACLGTLIAGHVWMGPLDPANPVADGMHQARAPINLDEMFVKQEPRVQPVRSKLPTGAYGNQNAAKAEKQDEGAADVKATQAALEEQAKVMHGQLAMNLARRDGDALAKKMDRAAASPQYEERFKSAQADSVPPKAQAIPGKKGGPVPVPPGGGGMKGVAPAAGREREFAHVHTPGLLADTLLWHPTLWLENGAGEVHFEIGSGQATYRVLLLGHTPTGRFGIFETRLDASGVGR